MNELPPTSWHCEGCGKDFAMDVSHACPGRRKDAMTPNHWQRIKQLRVRPTMMFQSCEPDKNRHTRMTYRKVEHAK